MQKKYPVMLHTFPLNKSFIIMPFFFKTTLFTLSAKVHTNSIQLCGLVLALVLVHVCTIKCCVINISHLSHMSAQRRGN